MLGPFSIPGSLPTSRALGAFRLILYSPLQQAPGTFTAATSPGRVPSALFVIYHAGSFITPTGLLNYSCLFPRLSSLSPTNVVSISHVPGMGGHDRDAVGLSASTRAHTPDTVTNFAK